MRRKFAQKFKDHPGFLKRNEMRQRWQNMRKMRNERRERVSNGMQGRPRPPFNRRNDKDQGRRR